MARSTLAYRVSITLACLALGGCWYGGGTVQESNSIDLAQTYMGFIENDRGMGKLTPEEDACLRAEIDREHASQVEWSYAVRRAWHGCVDQPTGYSPEMAAQADAITSKVWDSMLPSRTTIDLNVTRERP